MEINNSSTIAFSSSVNSLGFLGSTVLKQVFCNGYSLPFKLITFFLSGIVILNMLINMF